MAEIADTIELPDEIELPDGEQSATPPGTPAPAEAAAPIKLTAEQISAQLTLLTQSLADALSDGALSFVRHSIVTGASGDAAKALLFAALHHRIALSDVEYAVLAECLVGLDEPISTLDYLTVGQTARPVYFEFRSGPAAEALAPDLDQAPDLERADPQAEEVDTQVIALIGAHCLGIWRAWRYPAAGSPWPAPRPCYLVEAPDADAAQAVVAACYPEGALAADPQIEVYIAGHNVPALLRAIQFSGPLVHAGQGAPDFQFADVFVGEPDEQGRPQQLERVEDQTRVSAMAAYLASGKPLMMADSEGEDLLDEPRGAVVPLHLRTDGVWIWSEASAYYLTEHAIAPPPEFLTYLEGVGAAVGPVADTVLHQAASWLQAE